MRKDLTPLDCKAEDELFKELKRKRQEFEESGTTRQSGSDEAAEL